MRSRPQWRLAAGLLSVVLSVAAFTQSQPQTPLVHARSSAPPGCGPHTTFDQSCALTAGTVSDALPAGNAVNYYRAKLPAEGQALQVELGSAPGMQVALLRDASGVTGPVDGNGQNQPQFTVDEFGPALPADASAANASPQSSVDPFATPFTDTPFTDTPFTDTPFTDTPFTDTSFGGSTVRPIQLLGLAGGSGATKTLTHFTDALDAPGIATTPARTPDLIIAVWSAVQATDTYTLTVRVLQSDQTCQSAQAVLPAVPDGFARRGSDQPVAPTNVNTVILINETRWARLYGSDGARSVMDQLGQLAASPQVNGAILSVDANPDVDKAYQDWNANQCSATLANVVAARTKRLLDGFLAAHSSVRYIVLAGGDAVLPFFRVPDTASIANELQYAGQTGLNLNSATAASYASRNLLTDDYYADPHGTLSGPRILFTAQRPIGRLVESPSDIAATVQTFLQRNGQLQAVNGLVTGYDFLRDTASTVAGLFSASMGTTNNVAQLNNDGWGQADIDKALAGQAAGANDPDLVFFSGHFAHSALQTAAYDGYPATSLQGKSDLAGKLLYSLGCHSGASEPDVFADPSTGRNTVDWPQSVLGLGGVLVGNTGFGYGDSDLPAYGQELMTEFTTAIVSGGSSAPIGVGDALMQAKNLYRSRNDGKWDSYHGKTLMEATLYGLPMYGVSVSQPGPGLPQLPALPVTATSARYATSAAPTAGLTKVHAEIDVSGLQRIDAASGLGSYFRSADGVDIRAFQPVQPQLSFAPPQYQGLTLHGVVLTGATFQDMPGFDPLIVRPVWDRTEPEPQFLYGGASPAGVATFNSQTTPGGTVQQSLVLSVGQFSSSGQVAAGNANDPANPYVSNGTAYPHTLGTERLYSHLSLDLYYSDSANHHGPAITANTLTCATAGSTTVSITLAGKTAIQTVNLLAILNGATTTVPLNSQDGLTWTGTLPVSMGAALSVVAVDAAGNITTAPLSLPASVAAGCTSSATPTPAPTATATTQPARGSVRLSSAQLQGLFGGALAAVLAGSWDTGGVRCNMPGTTWTLGFFLTRAGATPTSSALPDATIAAPCPSGLPGAYTDSFPVLDLQRVQRACAAIFHTAATNFGAADATDCQPLVGGANLPINVATATPTPTVRPTPTPTPTSIILVPVVTPTPFVCPRYYVC